MEGEASESRNRARLAILELANMISVPMSLQAAVKLNVADAIWHGGANTPVSASDILSRIGCAGDAENLQRILRMLTSYGVFNEHFDGGDGSDHRKYSLTEIGQMLVPDGDGNSCGDFVLQHHQDALMKAWPLVHEAVLDSSTAPFVKANGEPAYSYYGKKPEMNALMKKAMSGVSVPFMKAILAKYNGFEGVKNLVDVGGSAGDSLKMIMQKWPNVVHGINFDLPEVVAKAPYIPGVTHVGGDMLKSVPSGDAIFIKWTFGGYTDDDCKLIMKNCYNALPAGGKFIVCESVLPKETDDSHRTRALLEMDIKVMTIYKAKAKNRAEEEFKQYGVAAGFSSFKAYYIDYYFTILEFVK